MEIEMRTLVSGWQTETKAGWLQEASSASNAHTGWTPQQRCQPSQAAALLQLSRLLVQANRYQSGCDGETFAGPVQH